MFKDKQNKLISLQEQLNEHRFLIKNVDFYTLKIWSNIISYFSNYFFKIKFSSSTLCIQKQQFGELEQLKECPICTGMCELDCIYCPHCSSKFPSTTWSFVKHSIVKHTGKSSLFYF